MKARTARRVTRTRNIIIVSVAVVIILVIGYGIIYSTGITEGEYHAGEHYRIVDNPIRRHVGEPITVVEFFSYGCIHCREFDPLLQDWLQHLPAAVSFDRSPVAFSSSGWQLLAQAYFALKQLDALKDNHDRLFRAIGDNGRQFTSADMIADFVDGHGTTKAAFLHALNSPEVGRSLRRSEALQRRFSITSIPTLVVAGKYVVNMQVGRKISLDIVDYLIAIEQHEAAQPTTTGTSP